MSNRDIQILMHIQSYCGDIEECIQRFGNDYTVFISDRAYIHAVSMCIMQIGELANHLTEEYRQATKEQMPWGMIRGMRNLFAHGYGTMDESVIWETATNDIPHLNEFCAKQLKETDM